VIASAEAVKTAYVRQLGISPGLVKVVYNAVRWDRLETTKTRDAVRAELAIPADRLVFGVVATLQQKKGHRGLLEAFAQSPALAGAQLMLIGDGPLRGDLERQARDSGIGERVTFCGTRRDLGNVLSAMDVFVLPSLWEGLPLALELAMGAGLPVVASALAGIPEVIDDGRTGLLVPAGDVGALGRAMTRLAASAAERSRLGAAAREAVIDRFGADAYVSSVTTLYEQFLAGAAA
jgi:glycosyltransferase involved in cell wall biosynthesis